MRPRIINFNLYTLIVLVTSFYLPILYASQASKITSALLAEDEKKSYIPFANSNATPENSSSWAIYFDNDVLVSSSDQDYTGGLAFAYSGPQSPSYFYTFDSILVYVNELLNIYATNKMLYSNELGLTAFTPENIDDRSKRVKDRPYASLLYLSSTRQYVQPNLQSSIISSLTIGVLGLDIVGRFQNQIHKLTGTPELQGWKNQISNNGELTFRYSISKQQIINSSYSAGNSNYEIKVSRKASIGYLSELSWSISGRFGRLRAPWWTFNPETTEYAEKAAPLVGTNSNKLSKELYAWMGMSFHLRAYNVFLQGQFRDSAVTYSSSELNHLIGEAWMGITKEIVDGIKISYFIRGQTSEIKQGYGSRNPVWGGIIVSKHF